MSSSVVCSVNSNGAPFSRRATRTSLNRRAMRFSGTTEIFATASACYGSRALMGMFLVLGSAPLLGSLSRSARDRAIFLFRLEAVRMTEFVPDYLLPRLALKLIRRPSLFVSMALKMRS